MRCVILGGYTRCSLSRVKEFVSNRLDHTCSIIHVIVQLLRVRKIYGHECEILGWLVLRLGRKEYVKYF